MALQLRAFQGYTYARHRSRVQDLLHVRYHQHCGHGYVRALDP